MFELIYDIKTGYVEISVKVRDSHEYCKDDKTSSRIILRLNLQNQNMKVILFTQLI